MYEGKTGLIPPESFSSFSKTEYFPNARFVVTVGTGGCHHDNLRCPRRYNKFGIMTTGLKFVWEINSLPLVTPYDDVNQS